MLIIEKGTYGSSERPCIWFTDTDNDTLEYIEYPNVKIDYVLAKLEKAQVKNKEIKIINFI